MRVCVVALALCLVVGVAAASVDDAPLGELLRGTDEIARQPWRAAGFELVARTLAGRAGGHVRHRLGITCTLSRAFGVSRVAHTIAWALWKRPLTHVTHISVFDYALHALHVLDIESVSVSAARDGAHGHASPIGVLAVPAGQRCSEWVRAQQLDTLVAVERVDLVCLREARARGVRVFVVPMLDWMCTQNVSVHAWVDAVRELGATMLAPSDGVATLLMQYGWRDGVDLVRVPWSVPDLVIDAGMSEAPRDAATTFVVNAGRGGVRSTLGNVTLQRRGVALAVAAFCVAHRRRASERAAITLIVKSADTGWATSGTLAADVRDIVARQGVASLDGAALAACAPHVRIVDDVYDDARMASLYADLRADAVLYPSYWEGIGLSLLEAQHAAMPVIATNSVPMCDWVTHMVDGILVDGTFLAQRCVAPVLEVGVLALADAIDAFARNALWRDALRPDAGRLRARQHELAERLRATLVAGPDVGGARPPWRASKRAPSATPELVRPRAALVSSHATLDYFGWLSTQLSVRDALHVLDQHALLGARGALALSRFVVNVGAENGFSQDPLFELLRPGVADDDPVAAFRGLCVERDARFARNLATNVPRCTPLLETMTPANALALLRRAGVPRNVDVLKIDVDGCDCDLADALLAGGAVRPKLVVLEVNVCVPPPLRVAQACHDGDDGAGAGAGTGAASAFVFGGGDLVRGCSLAEAAARMQAHGYTLLQLHYVNAFFVADELADAFAPVLPPNPAAAYAAGFARAPRTAAHFLRPERVLACAPLVRAGERHAARHCAAEPCEPGVDDGGHASAWRLLEHAHALLGAAHNRSANSAPYALSWSPERDGGGVCG